MEHEEGTPLQEWATRHAPGSEMVYKEGYWNQVIFVRDVIARIPWRAFAGAGEGNIRVVGTHTSKSIYLPVYSIMVGGIEIRMRGNFHDWKVSIRSGIPVPGVFPSFIKRDETIHRVYFEGFEREWIFGSYNNDPKAFSVEIYDEYDLFAFLTAILDAMRTK